MNVEDLLEFNIKFSPRIYDDMYRFNLDTTKPIVYNLFKNNGFDEIYRYGKYDRTVYNPDTNVMLNKKSHLEDLL